MLQNRIDNSRSPIASKIAEAQKDYIKEIENILKDNSISSHELTALYAEYAMDFALQAIQHALLASLDAIDLQMTEEEINRKGDLK